MTDQLPCPWRTSTYSGSQGTSCVQVTVAWLTSSYSGGQGTSCVQIALVDPDHVTTPDAGR